MNIQFGAEKLLVLIPLLGPYGFNNFIIPILYTQNIHNMLTLMFGEFVGWGRELTWELPYFGVKIILKGITYVGNNRNYIEYVVEIHTGEEQTKYYICHLDSIHYCCYNCGDRFCKCYTTDEYFGIELTNWERKHALFEKLMQIWQEQLIYHRAFILNIIKIKSFTKLDIVRNILGEHTDCTVTMKKWAGGFVSHHLNLLGEEIIYIGGSIIDDISVLVRRLHKIRFGSLKKIMD